MEPLRPLSPELQACVDALRACQRSCLETAASCLPPRGLSEGTWETSSESPSEREEVRAGALRWMLDCAELCQAGANLVLRRSPLQGRTLALCAEACDACAEACEDAGEAILASCARACRSAAELCLRVLPARRAA